MVVKNFEIHCFTELGIEASQNRESVPRGLVASFGKIRKFTSDKNRRYTLEFKFVTLLLAYTFFC